MILEKIIAFLANLFWFLVKLLATPEGIILSEIGIIIVLLFILKSHKGSKTAKILETGKSNQWKQLGPKTNKRYLKNQNRSF